VEETLMGLMQREKGKAFERKIAAELRALCPRGDIHRSSQAERAREPDVVIAGDVPEIATRLWLELQDARDPRPLDKLAQAERDVAAKRGGALPIVLWHRIRELRVQATMRGTVYFALVGFQCIDPNVLTLDWEDLKAVLAGRTPPAQGAT
jgi:hypothetical protein